MQQPCLLHLGRVGGRRRWGTSPVSTPVTTTVGHSRPLAAWNVSSSTPATVGGVERVGRRHPRAEAAPSPPGCSRRNSSTAAATRRAASSAAIGDAGVGAGRVERVVGPRPEAPRLTAARRRPGRPDRAGVPCREGPPALPAPARRPASAEPGQLLVGAGEHGHAAVARRRRRSSERTRRPRARLVGLVVGRGPDARRPVGAADDTALLVGVGGPQHVGAGGDDLRRAAMVGREADDLDAGQVVGRRRRAARVGAVEPVDRLAGSPTRKRSLRLPTTSWQERYCTGLRSWASSTSRWRKRQRTASAEPGRPHQLADDDRAAGRRGRRRRAGASAPRRRPAPRRRGRAGSAPRRPAARAAADVVGRRRCPWPPSSRRSAARTATGPPSATIGQQPVSVVDDDRRPAVEVRASAGAAGRGRRRGTCRPRRARGRRWRRRRRRSSPAASRVNVRARVCRRRRSRWRCGRRCGG